MGDRPSHDVNQRVALDRAELLPAERIEGPLGTERAIELIRGRARVGVDDRLDPRGRERARAHEPLDRRRVDLVLAAEEGELDAIFVGERLVALERESEARDVERPARREGQERELFAGVLERKDDLFDPIRHPTPRSPAC